jgi:hypothetical protein
MNTYVFILLLTLQNGNVANLGYYSDFRPCTYARDALQKAQPFVGPYKSVECKMTKYQDQIYEDNLEDRAHR